jgi:hypothetical protein
MTLSKKMNFAASLRTSAGRRAASVKARTRTSSLAVKSRLNENLLDEIGAWLVFAAISLTGWLAAAVAFGVL